jgi:hypothetical protein
LRHIKQILRNGENNYLIYRCEINSKKRVFMTKIIHVRGSSNSGKSTSIRLFLEKMGIYLPTDPKDFKIVFPHNNNGEEIKIGVASGGDNEKIVKENFKFFAGHDCDIIVCASKSRGESYDAVKKYEKKLNADYTPLETTKENEVLKQSKNNKKVAKEIKEHVLKLIS